MGTTALGRDRRDDAMTMVTYVPWRAADKYHHYRGMRADVRALAAGGRFGTDLVLVRGKRFPDYASAFAENPVDLRSHAAIYAWDRDPRRARPSCTSTVSAASGFSRDHRLQARATGLPPARPVRQCSWREHGESWEQLIWSVVRTAASAVTPGSRKSCISGRVPLANAFLASPAEFASERRFPLDLYFCDRCGLLQLLDVVNPEVLFRHYVYMTGISTTIARHNREYARTLADMLGLTPNDLVVEIASNDGSLLRCFQELGVKTLGVEPATNIAARATADGVETVNEFFTSALAESLATTRQPARVIAANNVLAHSGRSGRLPPRLPAAARRGWLDHD
jgi:hypothetical protein